MLNFKLQSVDELVSYKLGLHLEALGFDCVSGQVSSVI